MSAALNLGLRPRGDGSLGPLWLRGTPAGAWVEIPNSSMGDCVPTNEALTVGGVHAIVGPSSRMDAWCGFSIDTRSSKVHSYGLGGHGDYFGNEALDFDAESDAPIWREQLVGSSGNVVPDGSSSGGNAGDPSRAYYSDGLPSSLHSNYGSVYIEAQNRALTMGGAVSSAGSAFENVHGYDTVNKTRDANGKWGFALKGINGGWVTTGGWFVAKDPRDESVYVGLSFTFVRHTPNGDGWTTTDLSSDALPVNSGAQAATAVDTKRGRLVWFRGYGSTNVWVYDLDAAAPTGGASNWSEHTHPASAGLTALDAKPGVKGCYGMVYEPVLDVFLIRGSWAGADVFAMDPVTFEISLLALPTASVPEGLPKGDGHNVYTRWLVASRLGGILYFPKSSENAWFLNLKAR